MGIITPAMCWHVELLVWSNRSENTIFTAGFCTNMTFQVGIAAEEFESRVLFYFFSWLIRVYSEADKTLYPLVSNFQLPTYLWCASFNQFTMFLLFTAPRVQGKMVADFISEPAMLPGRTFLERWVNTEWSALGILHSNPQDSTIWTAQFCD